MAKNPWQRMTVAEKRLVRDLAYLISCLPDADQEEAIVGLSEESFARFHYYVVTMYPPDNDIVIYTVRLAKSVFHNVPLFRSVDPFPI